ncbi:MAG: hypothetical protein Fur0022_03450 [Anaerolineales bacterium]
MTTRINLTPFEQARRAELERLTGCPIHHVIEGVCREPGCQNAALQFQKELVMSEEDCLRLREVALTEGGIRSLTGLVAPIINGAPSPAASVASPLYTKNAAPIFQTKPRLRCVL